MGNLSRNKGGRAKMPDLDIRPGPRPVVWPVKLNDSYTCQGIDAEGNDVVFYDLLSEGEMVGEHDDGQGNVYGPWHMVSRREDGLWIE